MEWISVDCGFPKFNLLEDGSLVSSLVLFRCNIDKTVHLGVCEKIWIDSKNKASYPIYRWFDQYGDEWECVSHWTYVPEPPEVTK